MSNLTNQVQNGQSAPAARRTGGWNLGILFVFLFALVYTVLRSPESSKGWVTDFAQAKSQAASSGRMMLVKFTLPGCPACAAMERTVLRKKAVVDALKGFVPVQVDGDREPDLAQHYGIDAAPSFVVTDEQGNALRQMVGVVPVPEFLAFLGNPSNGPDGTPRDQLSQSTPKVGDLPTGP